MLGDHPLCTWGCVGSEETNTEGRGEGPARLGFLSFCASGPPPRAVRGGWRERSCRSEVQESRLQCTCICPRHSSAGVITRTATLPLAQGGVITMSTPRTGQQLPGGMHKNQKRFESSRALCATRATLCARREGFWQVPASGEPAHRPPSPPPPRFRDRHATAQIWGVHAVPRPGL